MSESGKRTPVLVGAAAVQQRLEDPNAAREPIDLMQAALAGAAADAGAPEILTRASSIRVPRGFWPYADPGRLLAQRLSAPAARTEVAEIGVLQTTLLGAAARDIASGKDDVVLITGGEARYRSRCATKLGVEESFTTQNGETKPDRVWTPAKEVLHDLELERGLAMPVNQYSMIENALRAAGGVSIDVHRDQIAELYAELSATAADNPDAWNRSRIDAATIRGGEGNPILAFPYTKLHTSQWNVDQASAFILTSSQLADELGIEKSRWLYPYAVVESNLMLALCERRDIDRCIGFTKAAEKIESVTGHSIADATHLELYSCFPSAVRLQMAEMKIADRRKVSVTGGMAYAGGPLNNFSFQALAKMAQILREQPDSTGAVTAVSGVLTKQGVSLWSARAPRAPFHYGDVSEATAAASAAVTVDGKATGNGRIATYTILYPTAAAGVLVCLIDLDDGRRTIVASGDQPLAKTATSEEIIGRRVDVAAADRIALL